MTDATVIPLHPCVAGYTDTLALNDIHALLTTGEPGSATLADVALILARAGRPLVAARDIEVTATETSLGRPVACVQSGDTSVFVRQETGTTVLLIEVCTKTLAERDALTITLDGQILHPGGPDEAA
jgi:hypothetical protein